jgi:hypothetical protein
MPYIVQVKSGLWHLKDRKPLWVPARRKAFQEIKRAKEYEQWVIRTYFDNLAEMTRVVETKNQKKFKVKAWEIIR